VKLTEWSGVFMFTQKSLQKMLSNRFYLSLCPSQVNGVGQKLW